MIKKSRDKLSKKTVFYWLLLFIKKKKLSFIIPFICSVFSVAISLFIPYIIGETLNCIVSKGNVIFNKILEYLLLLSIIIIIDTILKWFISFLTAKTSYKITEDMRNSVFEKINIMPLKLIDKASFGDFQTRIVSDIDLISNGILQGFNQLFSGVLTITGTLIFMLIIDYKIALLVIALTPISLLVSAIITKSSYKMFSKQAALNGDLAGFAEEIIANQKGLKTFQYEKRSIEKFVEKNNELKKIGIKAQFVSALSNPGTRFVNGIVFTTVGVFGAIAVLSGNFSIGMLSCFLTYSSQYTKPFNEISSIITEIQTAFASAHRVCEILNSESETPDYNKKELIIDNSDIKFENVYFSYLKEKPLIQNFNLEVKSEQKIAIVGPTGCGKTTLINLLMRFYEVDKGNIYIKNQNINEFSRQSLRNNFGVVLQDSFLFSGTISENIAYGSPNSSKEDIIKAAKKAYAHSFIKRLEDGYDTILTENGGNLSFGQKQLLCIARIMLLDPQILILDEATSNIDQGTEMKIQKAFDTLMKNRTSFIVAHRLSTIIKADMILCMDKGNIVEQGNHEELIKKQGFYFNLYNSNSRL